MKTHKFGTVIAFVLFSLILGAQLSGCAGKEIDENNPQELFNDAEEDINDERYLLAIDKLKNIRNKFPYNNLATLAKLRLADVYFLQESYIEAAGAYESFRDMHPKHEKAAYVLFRIGESYFNQLPDTNDRDLTPGVKAIEAYRELLALYPKSEHAPQARERLKGSTDRLAAKERYIGDFYFKREMYDSAAPRYEKIIKAYPGTDTEQYAYWHWVLSLARQNKKDEAAHAVRLYLSRFPQGEYAKEAGQWLVKAGIKQHN